MKIVHIGDIHIRNLERHEEYKYQFKKFYNNLNIINPDYIVIVGDLYHEFVSLTNEANIIAGDFLTNLANIANVIIVEGNHDIMSKNKKRINSVETIVKILDNPNIKYLETSGFYEEVKSNIIWVNYSHHEKNLNNYPWIDIQHTKDKNKIYIGLFHDPVQSSKTSTGQIFNDKKYKPITFFDENDFMFLGDIHLNQFFRENGSAAYPSSLIQQNFGEALNDHGFLFWEIEDAENFNVKHIEIPNDHNYITFKIDENTNYDNLNFKSPYFTPLSEIRIIWKDYSANITYQNELKIRDYFHNTYNYDKIRIDKKSLFGDSSDIEMITESIDISNQQTQKNIFTEYLKYCGYSDSIIEEVLKIDDIISDRLNLNNNNLGISWSIDKIWFSNFKSYGDNNILDWKDKNGIYQIHGINQQGKTTILDAICYILYGKTLSTLKTEKNGNSRYINNKRDIDFCEGGAVININNDIYTIVRKTERKWNREKTEISSCPTIIDFYIGTDLSEEYKLNGEQRKNTQAIIEKSIGEFDDFIRLVLTTADNLNDLISMDRSVFIDSIIKDAGYDIFEKKLNEFKIYKKELNTTRINLDYDKYSIKQQELLESYDITNKNLIEINTEIIELETKKNTLNSDKENLYKILHNIDDSISNLDINEVNLNIELENDKIDKRKLQLEKIKEIEQEISNYNINKYKDKQDEYNILNLEISNINLKIKDVDIKISNYNSNINTINMDITNIINDHIKLLEKDIFDNENKILKLKDDFNNKIIIYKSDIKDNLNKLNIEKNTINSDILKLAEDGKKLKIENDEYEHSKICITCHRPLDENDQIIINQNIEKNKQKMQLIKTDYLKLKNLISEYDLKIDEINKILEQISNKDYSFDLILNDSYLLTLNNINQLKDSNEESNIKIELIKNDNLSNELKEQLKSSYDKKTNIFNEIDELENEKKKLNNNINNKSEILDNVKSELKIIKVEEDNYQKKKETIQLKDKINLDIEKSINLIEKYNIQILNYNKEINRIDENKKTKSQINILSDIIVELEKNIKNKYNEKTNINGNIMIVENDMKKLDDDLITYELQKKQEEFLEMYLKCVHREGIPSFLLKKSIHIINQELSNIINNVDFTVYFDDELNLKLSTISRLDITQNAIESSGMERTFIAVALKIALRKINNKSKPNFILLDEIMGKLVDESVELFIELIDNIKNEIDKLVIIEHIHPINYDYIIDVVKDSDGISSFTIE
jgi:DNA repair exonuclease SbcCD ATPase subunit